MKARDVSGREGFGSGADPVAMKGKIGGGRGPGKASDPDNRSKGASANPRGSSRAENANQRVPHWVAVAAPSDPSHALSLAGGSLGRACPQPRSSGRPHGCCRWRVPASRSSHSQAASSFLKVKNPVAAPCYLGI